MVKILIAGDYAPRERVAKLIDERQYEEIFEEVLNYTLEADYSIVNLEAPVVGSPIAEPIKKCGPNLKCSANAIEAVRYAGFDMVTLANNHIYDYGECGIYDTLSECSKKDVATVGGGLNITHAAEIAYKDLKGIRFTFVNCCESEYSIATESSGGANPLNPIQQYYSILEAKRNADKIIVIVHGGHEHFQLPSPRMQETYRFFIDAGADVVVNHHQHCYSGYEMYNGKPIFYGLGNFCFDWKKRGIGLWNQGYIVELIFDKEITFKLYPYEQCSETPSVKFLKQTSDFYRSINYLNSIIANKEILKQKINEYYASEYRSLFSVIEPLQNKYILALQKRKLLPSFQRKGWILKLYNYIVCESHRDKLYSYLKNVISLSK